MRRETSFLVGDERNKNCQTSAREAWCHEERQKDGHIVASYTRNTM